MRRQIVNNRGFKIITVFLMLSMASNSYAGRWDWLKFGKGSGDDVVESSVDATKRTPKDEARKLQESLYEDGETPRFDDMDKTPDAEASGSGLDIDVYNKENILDKMSMTDMLAKAAKGQYDSIVADMVYVNRVISVLLSNSNPNVILKAHAGQGKTTLVKAIAREIYRMKSSLIKSYRESIAALSDSGSELSKQIEQAKLESPEIADKIIESVEFQKNLAAKQGNAFAEFEEVKLLELDAANLSSGTQYTGLQEQKIQALIDRIRSDMEKGIMTVIFIDEVHRIAKSGSNQMNIMDALKPYLTTGEIRVVGATTHAEFKAYLKADGAFVRRFSVMDMPEITDVKEVTSILRSQKEAYKNEYRMDVGDNVWEFAALLAKRFKPDMAWPGSAFHILEEALAFKSKIGKLSPPESMQKAFSKITELREEFTALKAKGSLVEMDKARLAELRNEILERTERYTAEKELYEAQLPLSERIHKMSSDLKRLKSKIKILDDEIKQLDQKIGNVKNSNGEDAVPTNLLDEAKTKSHDLDELYAKAKMVSEEIEEMVEKRSWAMADKFLDTLTVEDLQKFVYEARGGMDAELAGASAREIFENLEKSLKSGFSSQLDTISSLVKAVRRSVFDMKLDVNKPTSFIMSGENSMIEKMLTLLAKARFGKSRAPLVIDGALLGDDAAKIFGHAKSQVEVELGVLGKAVTDKIYQVVWVKDFDLITDEKALRMFEEVLEKGKLSLQNGDSIETVSFSETVFVFTSNNVSRNAELVGELSEKIGRAQVVELANRIEGMASPASPFGGSSVGPALKRMVLNTDGYIHGNKLEVEDLVEMGVRVFDDLARVLAQRGINLKIDASVGKVIAKKSQRLDAAGDALAEYKREIQATLQERIDDAVIDGINGRIPQFGDTLEVSVENNNRLVVNFAD